MAYNKELEARIDGLGLEWPGTDKMKMFGGLGYTLGGHICVGVYKDSLIVRCGPDATEEAMRRPGARPFDITGRAMGGWVMVDQAGLSEDADLADWIDLAEAFVRTLPPK